MRNYPPPPPPPVGLDEKLWDRSKNVELRKGNIKITGDRELNSLRTVNVGIEASEIFELGRYKLTIGAGGVVVQGGRSHHFFGGMLTSSVGQIKFTPIANATYLLSLASVIADNGNMKVGLDIIGPNSSLGYRGIGLSGGESNTFTGDVNISRYVRLDLYKTGGAISVLGNLNVREGATVASYRGTQLGRNVRVLLQSKGQAYSKYELRGEHQNDITEKFNQLVVDGKGVIDFFEGGQESSHGLREIIIDDLDVTAGSYLLVKEWQDGRDHLLVRKSSEHVHDSLGRIEFENHDTRSVNLRDYDKDYWEIYALVPEPTTYGAVFGAAGLSLVLLRGRRFSRYWTV